MMTTGELLSMMCDLDLCGIEWNKNTLDDKVNTIIQKVFLSNDEETMRNLLSYFKDKLSMTVIYCVKQSGQTTVEFKYSAPDGIVSMTWDLINRNGKDIFGPNKMGIDRFDKDDMRYLHLVNKFFDTISEMFYKVNEEKKGTAMVNNMTVKEIVDLKHKINDKYQELEKLKTRTKSPIIIKHSYLMYKSRYVNDKKRYGIALETAPNLTAIFSSMDTTTFESIEKSHIDFLLLRGRTDAEFIIEINTFSINIYEVDTGLMLTVTDEIINLIGKRMQMIYDALDKMYTDTEKKFNDTKEWYTDKFIEAIKVSDNIEVIKKD
jgi:hypothetical protein